MVPAGDPFDDRGVGIGQARCGIPGVFEIDQDEAAAGDKSFPGRPEEPATDLRFLLVKGERQDGRFERARSERERRP
jgi:hypothetical protein